MIALPEAVLGVLDRLEQNGFEGVVVGGAVRDALLGKTPVDWDVATDALPQQVCDLFERHIATGLRHGTVTVLWDDASIEVTTYRVDGPYVDGRRPQSVTFTPALEADLARRDFTINAMAYHPDLGLVDLYGGRNDLARRLIRTVGDPDRRFGEDALRMLRAVRFGAVLSFVIEGDTFQAICRNSALLRQVSGERIQAELDRLLLADCGLEVLFFSGLAQVCLPGVQMPDSSIYWLPKEVPLRLAKLLEGCPNPGDLLHSLRYNNAIQRQVLDLLACVRGPKPATDRDLRRLAAKYGPKTAEGALRLWGMDVMAFQTVLEGQPPLAIQDLAVTGRDLLQLGAQGKVVGLVLDNLLEVVLDLPDLNEKEKLLQLAGYMLQAIRRQNHVWQTQKEQQER